MKGMKKKIALLLATAMLGTALSACGAKKSAETEPVEESAPAEIEETEPEEVVAKDASDEVAVVGSRSEPATLDPHMVSYNSSVALAADLLYDGLVYYNSETDTIEPMLAEKWENVDDTTWRFYLRQDAVSSEGNPITASDVVYSFQRGAAQTALKSYYQYYDVENFEVVDDYTVDIKTFDYFPRIINHLAFYCFAILDQESIEAVGDESQMREPNCGSGPYKFAEWVSGDHITFERNENYYGQKPYYKTVTVRFIPDDTARVMALESGDVIAVDNILPSQVAGLKENENVSVFQRSICQTFEFILNTTHPAMQDQRVRQALSYALNREAALQIVAAGIGEVADGFFYKGLAEYAAPADPSTQQYDIERARELMAEAGYADGFDVSIRYMENQRYADMAEYAQNAWAELGVTVTLEPMESAAFFSAFNGFDFDIVAIAGSNSDMIIGLRNFDSASIGNGNNQGQYASDQMDEYIAGARTEKDETARNEYLAQIQELIREDVPVIPVFYGVALQGTSSEVQGLKLSVMGDVLYRGLQAR